MCLLSKANFIKNHLVLNVQYQKKYYFVVCSYPCLPLYSLFIKTSYMKTIFTFLLSILISTTVIFGQNNVEFSASDNWIGYMNVFNLPENGGAYEFGSAWVVEELQTLINVAENSMSLQPNYNVYANGPTDAYWVDQTTLAGNKEMEALTFVEPGASFNGQDLTFSGNVLMNSLAPGYTAKFFIKALDPNNDYQDALGGSKIVDLPADGSFSVTATAAELAAGLVIQYGFSIYGVNANPDDEASLGSVRIGNLGTSTENIADAITVTVFPNPVSEVLSIKTEDKLSSYQITNLSGQLMIQGTEKEVNVSSLIHGIYIVTVDLGDRKEVMKLIKN